MNTYIFVMSNKELFIVKCPIDDVKDNINHYTGTAPEVVKVLSLNFYDDKTKTIMHHVIWEKPIYSKPGPWIEASKAVIPTGHYYEKMAPDGTKTRCPHNDNGKLRSFGCGMKLFTFVDAVAVRDLGPNPPLEE